MKDELSDLRISNCGSLFKAEREKRGKGLRQVAAALGYDRSWLSKVENDKIAVSVELVEQLADELGMKRGELIVQCLERRFPKLRTTEAGQLLVELFTA